jgi:hypothetical protein
MMFSETQQLCVSLKGAGSASAKRLNVRRCASTTNATSLADPLLAALLVCLIIDLPSKELFTRSSNLLGSCTLFSGSTLSYPLQVRRPMYYNPSSISGTPC